MNKHKEDIGVLLKEKLSKAQKSPSDNVWNNINGTLDRDKRKKRVIFFWFTIGIALFLSLLYLSIGTSLFNSHTTNKSEVEVETKNGTGAGDNKNSIKEIKTSNSEGKDKTETEVEAEAETNNNDSTNFEDTNFEKESISNNKSLSNKTENNLENQNGSTLESNSVSHKNNNTKTGSTTKTNNQNIESKSGINNTTDTQNTSIVSGNKNANTSKISGTSLNKNNTIKDGDNSNSDQISENKSSTNSELENRLKLREERKDSIIKVRTERKDSIAKLRAPKEELIEEVEKKDSISEEKKEKFHLNFTLIAAPQFSAITKSGSMIHLQLEDLDTKGAFNFNYGTSLNFMGTKYMYSIGVLKTSISYQTLNIPILDPFYQIINGEEVLVYPKSILDFNTVNPDAFISYSTLESFKSTDGTIHLTQNIEYIEVPLQFTYFLNENRFGFQFYGGVSGYFLTDNSLIAKNELGEKLTIGKVNNLSEISLSANIGAGIYYKISEIFTAELNPSFKFLYKPTNTESTKGSVLLFGIYTGIRINLFSKK